MRPGAVISADARARNADALSLPEQLPVASYRLSSRQTTTVLRYSGGRWTRPRHTFYVRVYDMMRPSSFVINALRGRGGRGSRLNALVLASVSWASACATWMDWVTKAFGIGGYEVGMGRGYMS